MSKKIIMLGIASFLILQPLIAQNINHDPKQGAVNINLPKTPESAAFENDAKASVNEAVGGLNVAIPLYTLKSEFLEVPISLNYNANGIKVSQEASWTGLGWDLVAGGRITVDIKGCPDYFNPGAPTQGQKLQKLFNRLGNESHVPIFTYATPNTPSQPPSDTAQDDWDLINNAAQYGTAEPDVYRANFLGQNCSFYFDKITGSLEYLDEKKHFRIQHTKNAFDRITNWKIWDTKGIQYFFDDIENTQALNGPLTTIIGNEGAGTAWLLTKIVHPSGDSVRFFYTNYGQSYPAFNWSFNGNSVSCSFSPVSPSDQYTMIQNPKYLTKIENGNTSVEFALDNRLDLKGAGSKSLSEIKVIERNDSRQVKNIKFTYGYFNATNISAYSNSLTEPSKSYAVKRLKLTQLSLHNEAVTGISPYKFFYKEASLPDKYSYSQDHYGYYNGASNTGLVPSIPVLDSITQAACIRTSYPIANRDVNTTYTSAFVLDSINNPMSGTVKFILENQKDSVNKFGPGLRIAEKREYTQTNKIANLLKYEYGGGQLMGKLQYYKLQIGMQTNMPACAIAPVGPCMALTVKLGTNGYSNDNEYDILYNRVTIKQFDQGGNFNGYSKKVFYTGNPFSTNMEGIQSQWMNGYNAQTGFRVLGGHYPNNVGDGIGALFANYTQFPPPPLKRLDGKLMTETVFDNNNNILKQNEYYYLQKQYSRNFYSLQAFDNDMSFPQCTCTPVLNMVYVQLYSSGERRYSIFVKPTQAFYTVTDSTVEKTYDGTREIIQRKKYKYNQFYEPENEITYSSDGTQIIGYTKSLGGISNDPNSISYPITTSDPEYSEMLMNMRINNVYDLPIEQTVLRRGTAGDTTVLGSRFIFYKAGNQPLKSYSIEYSTPPVYRTGFVPAYYSVAQSTIKKDVNYKLQETASYSANSLLVQLQNNKGVSAYVWDELQNKLTAECSNAVSSELAYTSFETASKGNFTYTGSNLLQSNAVTGRKAYLLSAGSISKAGLTVGKKYTVSYWSNGGAQNVNAVAGTAGRSFRGFTYYEHSITTPANGTITISGTAQIDELRLFPEGSLMTSFTYLPLVGLSNRVDANNRVEYYEYDVLNRLKTIRDLDGNVLKRVCYNYSGQAENCTDVSGIDFINAVTMPYSISFTNVSTSQVYTGTCNPGTNPVTVLSVPYGNYNISITPFSSINATLTVNGASYTGTSFSLTNLAINASTTFNIQPAAGGGSCSYSLSPGITSPTNSISSNGTTASGYFVFYSSSAINPGTQYMVATISAPCRPSATRNFTASSNGITWNITILSSGQMLVQSPAGSPVINANTTISFSPISYAL